ncbi:hypothetical protein PG994_004109 [Apiospora phragmitis]|uniref:C2H2-type domain-containing protein n=1 Tax=Apiospora phragmitis TaxID=2905665 RepID=A0ABR1VPN3_9PEZI
MSAQAEDRSKLLLVEAINKLDLPTLQKVFKDMCTASEDFSQQATQRLLIPGSAVKRTASESGSQEDVASSKKQKQEDASTARSRYEPCENCKQVFDVTINTETSCRYHDGQLELDEEAFPDDDETGVEKCAPDGFIWDCCEKNCNDKGCVVEEHVVAKPPPPLKLFGIKKSVPEIIEIEDDDDDEEEEEEEEEDESE